MNYRKYEEAMGGRSCSLAFFLVHKNVPTVVLACLSRPSPRCMDQQNSHEHLGGLVVT